MKDSKGQILRMGNHVTCTDVMITGKITEILPTGIVVANESGHRFCSPDSVTKERPYPVYIKEDIDKIDCPPGSVYLGLFHGFKDDAEREQYDDWGSNGPCIGPLDYVHGTYNAHLKYRFTNPSDARKYNLEPEAWLDFKDDCVIYGDEVYGDWTAFVPKKG